MTEHFDDEKDEIIDGDISEKNDDHEDDSDYEKFCFLCHRPESQAGKMIELPNNIHICNDCMQKSFDTMTQQMNNGLNLNDLLNMPYFVRSFEPGRACHYNPVAKWAGG